MQFLLTCHQSQLELDLEKESQNSQRFLVALLVNCSEVLPLLSYNEMENYLHRVTLPEEKSLWLLGSGCTSFCYCTPTIYNVWLKLTQLFKSSLPFCSQWDSHKSNSLAGPLLFLTNAAIVCFHWILAYFGSSLCFLNM